MNRLPAGTGLASERGANPSAFVVAWLKRSASQLSLESDVPAAVPTSPITKGVSHGSDDRGRPHKGSHTAVALDEHETVLGRLRVRTGPDQLLGCSSGPKAWPVRTWAVENAAGLGCLLAQQLVAACEHVVDAQPKLAARARLLDNGDLNKNDPDDARSVAVAALRAKRLVEVGKEDHTAVMRLWARRRKDVSSARTRANRLHAVMLELVPGGYAGEVHAAKLDRLLEALEPAGAVAAARKELAEELLADLRRLDSQLKADAGHRSLAEITAQDIRDALPETGSHRNWAEYGLRSLFKVLKDRKLVFANPTRGMGHTPVNATVPLPLDTDAVRDALDSPDLATALAVALVAFHALTAGQLAGLMLTDIVDGRISLDNREIPLAGPVKARLAAWLDHRARKWPATGNPHLFINHKSGPRLTPVGKQFPWANAGLRPQALREDRILQEIHATGGDVRRICDLFGVKVETAMR